MYFIVILLFYLSILKIFKLCSNQTRLYFIKTTLMIYSLYLTIYICMLNVYLVIYCINRNLQQYRLVVIYVQETDNTIRCMGRIKPATDITICIQCRENISSIFSRNSEAFDSEILKFFADNTTCIIYTLTLHASYIL